MSLKDCHEIWSCSPSYPCAVRLILLSLKFHSKGCPRSARGACFTLLSYYPQQGLHVNLKTTFNSQSYGWTHSLNRNKCLSNFGSAELPRGKLPFNCLSSKTLHEIYIWYFDAEESHFISKSSICCRVWLKGFGQVWWISLLMLFTTSASTCLEHSRNQTKAF